MKQILATIALLSAVAPAAASDKSAPDKPVAAHAVEMIDSRVVNGKVIGVAAGKVEIRIGGKTRTIPLRDVREVRLAKTLDLMGCKGQSVLATAGGGRLAVGGVSIRDGKVAFTNPLLGATRLPLSAAAVLYLPSRAWTPASLHKKFLTMKTPASVRDVIFLAQSSDVWLGVRGILKSMDAAAIRFETSVFDEKDTEREFSRKMVPVIRFAKVAAKVPKAGGTLVGRRGSTLQFTSLTMSAGSITIEAHGLGKRKIPRAAVASIRFASDRVTELSGLKPSAVRQHGLFGKGFGWRADRSVGGGAIRLDGRGYARGLGMHSFCELTFRIDGKYARFIGRVGIDDAVRPVGDAVVTFLGDGKALGEPVRVTGKTAATVVRLDVAKVRTLTIRVEFGPDKLDVGDHVDIAEARLIKSGK